MRPVVARFLKYISIDTQGNEKKLECPSNENERFLAELIQEELLEWGIQDTLINEKGFLYVKIPANCKKKIPALAFFEHLDTSPEVPGDHIKPRVVEQYKGGNIILNRGQNIMISPEEFPALNDYIGDDLIVTDGTTLLGADGKAGIAEVMEAIRYLKENPTFLHGDIYLVFSPDEELGYSTEYIEIDKVPAVYGYTVDEGGIGEINYENFNAATVSIMVRGANIHPGHAKKRMKNSILLATEFIRLLPENETPTMTEGYEGYYHISDIAGGVDQCCMTCNIRDFAREGYEYRKNRVKETVDFLNNYYGENTFQADIEDYYFNMKEKVDECPEIIEVAKEAMHRAGVTPVAKPIRGGTDGVTISY